MSHTQFISAVVRRSKGFYPVKRQQSESITSSPTEMPTTPAPEETESQLEAEKATETSATPTEKATLIMPTQTAAQTALAIPELLEQILLSTCQYGWRHLFEIQRVNSTYRDVIATSIHLRRRMFLEYELSPARSSIRFAHTLAYMEAWGIFEMKPYHWMKTDLGPRNTSIHLSLELPLILEQLAEPMNVIRGGDGSSQQAAKGSWRELKLTRFAVPSRVDVDVYSHGQYQPAGSLKFAAGEGTLGEFVDHLEMMRRKVYEQRNALVKNDDALVKDEEATQSRWRRRLRRFRALWSCFRRLKR